MPRFVILEHDHPIPHWDLMLEEGDSLLTWRLAIPPEAGVLIAAERSFDHRLLYLDYEGPISNDRGSVKRHEYGTFTWIERAAETFAIMLEGTRMGGEMRLVRSEKGQLQVLFRAC